MSDGRTRRYATRQAAYRHHCSRVAANPGVVDSALVVGELPLSVLHVAVLRVGTGDGGLGALMLAPIVGGTVGGGVLK